MVPTDIVSDENRIWNHVSLLNAAYEASLLLLDECAGGMKTEKICKTHTRRKVNTCTKYILDMK